MTDTTEQSIVRNGRKIAFSQYGDPKGKPVFYFHGWPASRLSGGVYDGIAKKLRIRVISPDRPGFGLSDYQSNRTLLDWPADVVAIADHSTAFCGSEKSAGLISGNTRRSVGLRR